MTLEEAVAQLERRLLYVHEFVPQNRDDSLPRKPILAPTGESYITMMSGGRKPEGGDSPAICRTPEMAAQLWRDAVQRYYCDQVGAAEGRSDQLHLYWLKRPESSERRLYTIYKDPPNADITMGETWYTVYSRLLISDKPVKE